jgi:hypothetical protein
VPADLPQKIVTALFGGGRKARPKTARAAIPVEPEPARPRRLPMRPELASAEARVSAMSRHLRVGETDIAWCLNQGRWPDAAVVIARLAGEPPELVMRGFETEDAGQVLPLMRLASLSWATVEKVLSHDGRALDEATLQAASERYERLSRDAADQAWRATKAQLTATAFWAA